MTSTRRRDIAAPGVKGKLHMKPLVFIKRDSFFGNTTSAGGAEGGGCLRMIALTNVSNVPVDSSRRKSKSSIRKRSKRHIQISSSDLKLDTSGNSKSVQSSTSSSLGTVINLSEPVDNARHALLRELGHWGAWRRKAMSTILHLAGAYNVKDETAAHAMSLLDRFLAANLSEFNLSSEIWNKSDCFATACFLLATKFKDVTSPCTRDLVRVVRLPWPEEHIGRCEGQILCSIEWALHMTTGILSNSRFSFVFQ